MHHAEAVRVGERVAELAEERANVARSHVAAAPNPIFERACGDERRDEVKITRLLAAREQRQDVRMAGQLACGLHDFTEARKKARLACELRIDDLDNYLAATGLAG